MAIKKIQEIFILEVKLQMIFGYSYRGVKKTWQYCLIEQIGTVSTQLRFGGGVIFLLLLELY